MLAAPAEPAMPIISINSDELAAAEADVLQNTADLATARDAVASNDAAIKVAEQSLLQLRETSTKLTERVTAREAALKKAALLVEELRKPANSQRRSIRSPAEVSQQKDVLRQRESFVQTANTLAKQIDVAASQSPQDIGLQTAARLAMNLQNQLSSDLELDTRERQRLEDMGNGPRTMQVDKKDH